MPFLGFQGPLPFRPAAPSPLDFPSATHTASIFIRQLSSFRCTYYASPCWKSSAQSLRLTQAPLATPLFSSGPSLHQDFSLLQRPLTSPFSLLPSRPLGRTHSDRLSQRGSGSICHPQRLLCTLRERVDRLSPQTKPRNNNNKSHWSQALSTFAI